MAIKQQMGRRSVAMLGALGLTLSGLWACNDRPLDPLDNVVTSVTRQENNLPAKTKIDFLFMVDNSGSMCEEQANLAKNFKAFTDFIFEDLDNAADYRLAVVSTDLDTADESGSFLFKPAHPDLVGGGCQSLGDGAEAVDTQSTAECFALDNKSPIIRSDDIGKGCAEDDKECFRRDLELQFRCRATLGTRGSPIEKGLEAIRLALSCDGPNKDRFSQCCENGVYNPGCTIREGEVEPDFLRPDAVLAVVIISDEDDCSAPVDNPKATRRVVCRDGGTADGNNDGMPDAYNDRKLCPDLQGNVPACESQCSAGGAACEQCRRRESEKACYVRECSLPACAPGQASVEGQCITADDCRKKKCSIKGEGVDNYENSRCEWNRSNLTPVEDYYNFLVGLKPRPGEQLLVASIVGLRDYTSWGDMITYNEVLTVEQRVCVDEPGSYDPGKSCESDADCPGTDRCESDGYCSGETAEEVCCPGGKCPGHPQFSCESINGAAIAGRRYLRLSELFDEAYAAGVGCPPGMENDADCVHICVDDFAGPLERVREKIVKIIGTYCLDKPPACQVPTDDGPRACATDEERDDVNNYNVSVRMRCLRTPDQTGPDGEPGKCAVFTPMKSLNRDAGEWKLSLGVQGCSGGARVELDVLPPAGAEVFVEYPVQVGTQSVQQSRPDAALSDVSDAGF